MPPVWIDLQEQVDENIDNITQLIEELRPLKNKRFSGQKLDAATERKMDVNISQLVTKIAKLIKLSDEKLKEMANPDSLMDENQKKQDAA